jgi:hypothetical protein
MLAFTAVDRSPDTPGFLSIAPPCPKPSATTGRSSLSIDNLTHTARLANLYQISFPSRLDLLEQEIDLASEESLSQATARFLQRVESELFPVYWDIWFEVGEMDWCLYNIPLACQGFGVGYDDPADYPEPICLFLRLAERQYFEKADDQTIAEIYSQLVDVPAVVLDGIDRLSELLQDMGLTGPLAAIPGLTDRVFQQTGNPLAGRWPRNARRRPSRLPSVSSWKAAASTAIWPRANAAVIQTMYWPCGRRSWERSVFR